MMETMQDRAIRIIEEGAEKAAVSTAAFLEHEISRVKQSQEWKWMITGDEYYKGRHAVLHKERTAIGEDGKPVVVDNLPNARHIDNVYRRMVKQKTNYLLGKPFRIDTENDKYREQLSWYLDKNFRRTMKNLCKNSLNCGIAWMYCYYDEQGEFQFKQFRPYEIIPEWKDVDHTQLESVIRFYDVKWYDGQRDKTVEKVEYYTRNGIDFFESNGSSGLLPCEPYHLDYMQVDGQGFNWDRLPFIAFKYNDEEIPLIVQCKSLQDGLNEILSNFNDQMDEDSRKTILVLVNYDGQNLGEFRRNLATYGVVKVSTVDGVEGNVRTLQVEVNAENYRAITDIFKRAIIENCMGYDVKDEKLAGNPNQMNIQSMYNDIDLDASDMETEYQAAMDDLLYFLDLHLLNTGRGDFQEEEVTITFNTSMPMDETMAIQNAQNSAGIISKRTITAHHPWVTDLDAELEELEKEEQEEQAKFEQQYQPFKQDAEEDEEDPDEKRGPGDGEDE